MLKSPRLSSFSLFLINDSESLKMSFSWSLRLDPSSSASDGLVVVVVVAVVVIVVIAVVVIVVVVVVLRRPQNEKPFFNDQDTPTGLFWPTLEKPSHVSFEKKAINMDLIFIALLPPVLVKLVRLPYD